MKKKYIKYIIPLIMVFFFVRNLILVETKNLDSWMGGGMRMFGQIDKMLYRVSGFNINYNNKKYFVNLRNVKELEDEDIGLRILPSNERLQIVLNKIKKQSWCYNEETDSIVIHSRTYSCTQRIEPTQITDLKVYKISYNKNTKIVKLEIINNVKNP